MKLWKQTSPRSMPAGKEIAASPCHEGAAVGLAIIAQVAWKPTTHDVKEKSAHEVDIFTNVVNAWARLRLLGIIDPAMDLSMIVVVLAAAAAAAADRWADLVLNDAQGGDGGDDNGGGERHGLGTFKNDWETLRAWVARKDECRGKTSERTRYESGVIVLIPSEWVESVR